MKNIIIEKDGHKYKWSVEGLNEKPCMADIESNHRTELTDYVATMFSERYGCVASVQEVREMTHNQYQEFLKNNASRFHNETGYTMADYERDADSVIILGFDLSRFGLSEEQEKLINDAFASEDVNKNGHLLLRGRSEHVYALGDKLGCSCVCSGAYNGFFKNDEKKLVFEFCEGDISLVLCENEKEYRTELDSYYEFYEVENPHNKSLNDVITEATERSAVVGNNEYFKENDGWFTYYVNVKTGEKKFKLGDDDIEVAPPKRDDFYRSEVLE